MIDLEHIEKIDRRLFFFISGVLIVGIFLFFGLDRKSTVEYVKEPEWLLVPEAEQPPPEIVEEKEVIAKQVADIIPVPSLLSPPDIINAVYLTGWSAGSSSRIQYVIDLARDTEINAVVIDVKDYSGYVLYDTRIKEVEEYGAERILIPRIAQMLQKLHKEGIYVIARIVVFQDPILANARPELAIHSLAKIQEQADSILWLDNKELAWIDPAAKEAWEYNAKIGKEVIALGFDELNFDYIRFPSDGDIYDMSFPVWDEKTKLPLVLRGFFAYLRSEFSDAVISADVFGLATIWDGDFGIGQIIEDTFEYFDFVSPMLYPSHYAKGFLGYENPDEYPYEVVEYSMKSALLKLQEYIASGGNESKIRPWLQDFALGVEYDEQMVSAEIRAVKNAMAEDFSGFMLWSSDNVYTKEALR